MPMLWQTMNSGQVCRGKSWQWSNTVIVEIVNWGRGYSQTGGGMEKG